MNDDGTIDIYFAPEAPKELESNWIPTGEDFFLLFRLYGPDQPSYRSGKTLSGFDRV